MARRYYSSTAARTTLASGVDDTTTTFSVVAVSGWPASFPYTLVIDQDTINEELVEVTARSGTTLTVTRGVDGTTAVAHSAGAAVNHGVSARDFNEPNQFLNEGGTVTGETVVSSSGSGTTLEVRNTGSGNSFVVEDSANPDSTPFVVNASGRVGIGTTAPNSELNIRGSSFPTIYHQNNNDTPSNAAQIVFARGRGTAASPVAPSTGDAIGYIDFRQYDGVSAYRSAAAIYAQTDGTVGGATDVPGRLIFTTTPDGSNNATERMRIDSAGNVGIGTTSPASTLEVSGTGTGDSRISGTTGARLLLEDKGVADASAPFFFLFNDDSSLRVGNANRSGTSTTSSTERMRIQSDGAVLIGTTTPGSAGAGDLVVNGGVFLGGTAAANELDDYEEGTFTPTYSGATTDFSSVTYDVSTGGQYTKIGRVVYISGYIETDAITVGSAAGSLRVGGLPFTVASPNAAYLSAISVGFSASFAGEEPSSALTLVGQSVMQLYYRATADGNNAGSNVADVATGSNSNQLYFAGFYFTA